MRFTITSISAGLTGALAMLLAMNVRGGSEASAAHTRLTLVADEQAVAPGHTLRLGLRFELDEDWHIYWRNPGDSGEPPRALWQLPAGFHAGEVEWPYPIRLSTTSSIVDYGYQERVLLVVPVTPPAQLKAGQNATFVADVSWLVCHDICIPGKAQVTLSLPIHAATEPSPAAQEFVAARQLVPKAPPRAWKITAESGKDQFVLCVQTGSPEPQAAFFPAEPGQIENSAAPSVAAFDRGVRLTLRKSEQLQKPIATLKGVLVLGPGRAYEIAAPVAQK